MRIKWKKMFHGLSTDSKRELIELLWSLNKLNAKKGNGKRKDKYTETIGWAKSCLSFFYINKTCNNFVWWMLEWFVSTAECFLGSLRSLYLSNSFNSGTKSHELDFQTISPLKEIKRSLIHEWLVEFSASEIGPTLYIVRVRAILLQGFTEHSLEKAAKPRQKQ